MPSLLSTKLFRRTIFKSCKTFQKPWDRKMASSKEDCCCEDNRQPPDPSVKEQHSLKTYRAITLFVALPVILIMSGVQWVAYKDKASECPERPEFIAYPYLRIRTKRFPWGDGDKTLFHNPRVNALPSGYEDDLESE